MDVEELESVVDAMAEECGDQIDALYDTVTLNKDTYNGFICRLREVVRLAKNEQEKSAPVGNSAAMREALIKCYQLAYEWEANEREGIAGVEPDAKDSTETLFDIQQITTAALASPPRNCDVGDVADWENRFGEECDKGHTCSDCPVRHAKTRMAIELHKGARCEFIWAQMPYEEGGAK